MTDIKWVTNVERGIIKGHSPLKLFLTLAYWFLETEHQNSFRKWRLDLFFLVRSFENPLGNASQVVNREGSLGYSWHGSFADYWTSPWYWTNIMVPDIWEEFWLLDRKWEMQRNWIVFELEFLFIKHLFYRILFLIHLFEFIFISFSIVSGEIFWNIENVMYFQKWFWDTSIEDILLNFGKYF